MNLVSDIAVVAGLFSTLISIWVVFFNAKKHSDEKIKEKAINESKVEQEIFYISENVKDIKFNQRNFADEIKNINDRLIKVEEAIKNADERIDRIEEKRGL